MNLIKLLKKYFDKIMHSIAKSSCSGCNKKCHK